MPDIYHGWARLWGLIKTFVTDEPPPNKRPRLAGPDAQDTPNKHPRLAGPDAQDTPS